MATPTTFNQMVERQKTVDRLDLVFHALANRTRRRLLTQLSESDATVGELARPHRLSFAGVSKHIHVLAEAGLVDVIKEGRHRRYHMVRGALDEAADAIAFYRKFWDEGLAGLDGYLTANGDE